MENTLNEAQNTQVKEPKKGKKQIQALALAVLTVLWAEQATSPKIAYAGLAHAQQQTAQETQRVNAETQRVNDRTNFLERKCQILDTLKSIFKALNTVDANSKKAKPLLNQLYQMQVELVAVCTGLWKFYESDKWIIKNIDETLRLVNFTPDKTAPKIYVCDAKWCKI